MNENDRRDRPRGWWNSGMEYLTVGHNALDAMRSRTPRIRNPLRNRPFKSTFPSFPIYYCFLQGVELGLKAYLRHNDIKSMEQLKKIGHDIAKLLNIAEGNGIRQQLSWLTDKDCQILRFHSQIYKDRELAYIRRGGGSLCPVDDLVEVADKLLVGITDLIGMKINPKEHPWVGNYIFYLTYRR